MQMPTVKAIFALVFAAFFPLAVAADERPPAPQILPTETLAYVRVADTRELADKWQQTALGKIFNDPQIEPLVGQLFGEAVAAFGRIEDQVGGSLEDILSIPQGELCVAMVKPKQALPTFVLLLDVASRYPVAEKIIDRGETFLAERGATRSTEKVGDTELVIHRTQGERSREIAFCHRDEKILITGSVAVARQMLVTWDGGTDEEGNAYRTLADNSKFTTIMKRCMGTQGERPQITFFVDPIEIFKAFAQGSVAGQAGLALLPPLGLTGIRGFGGSAILATEEFDSIFHLHLLLANPRSGVLEMLAMTSGDTTPETWVPADAASYMTFNWDFQKTYDSLDKVYNSIRGEAALSRDIDAMLSQRLGIDVENEVVPEMAGRLTWATWMEKPARINSRSNLIAFKLKDAKKFDRLLDRVADHLGAEATRESFAGTKFIRSSQASERLQEDQRRDEPRMMRRPDPCCAVIGDYLVITDSSQFLKHVISTKLGRTGSLADELDYKLIASKIRRQYGGEAAGMIAFDRPEVGLRTLYDVANSDDTRRRLGQMGEDNGFFRVLGDALNDNPLPEFSQIQKYLAPSGGLMIDDETGLHYMAFSLKRN